MKIQGDAETSARTGIPTYTVREEDRHVTWSISSYMLLKMADWDALGAEDRAARLLRIANTVPAETGAPWAAFVESQTDPLDRMAATYGGSDWLEQHAIVARNSLRNFLDAVTYPDRRFHAYASPETGWLGWITVNGQVEAWIAADGQVIEGARVIYDDGSPTSYADLRGMTATRPALWARGDR